MREIETVAVVGAGYMGGGIAQSLAIAGADVRLADVDAEATRASYARLLAEGEEFETAGALPAGQHRPAA